MRPAGATPCGGCLTGDEFDAAEALRIGLFTSDDAADGVCFFRGTAPSPLAGALAHLVRAQGDPEWLSDALTRDFENLRSDMVTLKTTKALGLNIPAEATVLWRAAAASCAAAWRGRGAEPKKLAESRNVLEGAYK